MFLLDICWTWSVHAKGPASFGNSIRDARLVFSFWPFVRVAAGGRGRERDDVLLSPCGAPIMLPTSTIQHDRADPSPSPFQFRTRCLSSARPVRH